MRLADTGRKTVDGVPDGLLIGGHMSAAGGLYRALERGDEHGFTAVQLFLKSPTQWAGKALTERDAGRFRATLARTGISAVLAHNSYLINLASPDRELRERSIKAMRDELDRATCLGIPHLVSHLGAHMGVGEAVGLDTLVGSVDRIADARPDAPVRIVLETTAGQGTMLGGRFEHLAYVRSRVEAPERLAFCFDTCHVHVAGYDLTTRQGFDETCSVFDRVVGVEHLAVVHLNDAKHERGSRADRHEHIGQGRLGLDPFRWIMNSRTFSRVPKIVETPDMETMHPVNVARLRELVGT